MFDRALKLAMPSFLAKEGKEQQHPVCSKAGVVVAQRTCLELARGNGQAGVWDWWKGLDIFKGLITGTAAWEE